MMETCNMWGTATKCLAITWFITWQSDLVFVYLKQKT